MPAVGFVLLPPCLSLSRESHAIASPRLAIINQTRNCLRSLSAASRAPRQFLGKNVFSIANYKRQAISFAVFAGTTDEAEATKQSETTDDAQAASVREYLERNRQSVAEIPDNSIYVDMGPAGIGEMSRRGYKGSKGGKEVQIETGNKDEPFLKWFYREEGAENATRAPVLLIHGIPSQSYSFRDVLPALAAKGHRVIAPDLIGFGYSSQPQDGYGFDYTPQSFLAGLHKFVQAVGLDKMHIVGQGFLGADLAAEYALAHPDTVETLTLVSAPLAEKYTKLPPKLAPMKFPVVGEFIAQDVISVERTLEGGGPYVIPADACVIYRAPYQNSSDAGFALLATVRKLQLKERVSKITADLKSLGKPMMLLYGESDKYIPAANFTDFKSSFPDPSLLRVSSIAECGHYVQEDWHEKTTDALSAFFGANEK